MSRTRNFIFTWNNYGPTAEGVVQGLPTRYLVYGREVAPTTGTPHLQGYLSFANARTLPSLRRLLPGVHIDAARGSASQNRAYCIKGGDFYERGVVPACRQDAGARENERWDDALAAAKLGRLEEIDSDIVVRYYGALKRIRSDFGPPPANAPTTAGIWIHGLAGCGKTRTVRERYPEAYLKGANKWWCGYEEEEVVLLDDIDPSHASWIGRFLKIWGDRYPFRAELKGGSVMIRPLKFIITSQYSIEQVFTDTETREALNRRYVVIEKFINQNIII